MKFKLLDRYKNIRYLITRRDISYGCNFSMALHTGEEIDQILQNRAVVSGYFGKEYSVCGIRQVHGDTIVMIDERVDMGWSDLNDAPEADAVMTDLPQVVLTILTADCVPIFLFDPISQAIAAIHSGWRGAKTNIAAKSVNAMMERYGSRVEEIIACIGPSIEQCCYEVDDSVADHFSKYGSCVCANSKNGKYQLDLKSIIRQQLLKIGLKEENIELSSICTSCSSEEYFSYRKSGTSGRFLSAIAISSPSYP